MSESPAAVRSPARGIGEIVAAAQLACLLEATAPKPGNVSPGRHFRDVYYTDFLASAAAIGEPLTRSLHQGLGSTIRSAVEATRRSTDANTNLGVVLLLAPLVRAAAACQRPLRPNALRRSLGDVLAATTLEDAREVYCAIRLASPGGLGEAEAEDVRGEPTVTLLEAMRLAAHRDGIAREYTTGFDTTFSTAAPALAQARADGLSWEDAIVEVYLKLLAVVPDTHIARRAGHETATAVSRAARTVVEAGGVRTKEGRRGLAELDEHLRDGRNLRNPGTTADLTAAALFVILVSGT